MLERKWWALWNDICRSHVTCNQSQLAARRDSVSHVQLLKRNYGSMWQSVFASLSLSLTHLQESLTPFESKARELHFYNQMLSFLNSLWLLIPHLKYTTLYPLCHMSRWTIQNEFFGTFKPNVFTNLWYTSHCCYVRLFSLAHIAMLIFILESLRFILDYGHQLLPFLIISSYIVFIFMLTLFNKSVQPNCFFKTSHSPMLISVNHLR